MKHLTKDEVVEHFFSDGGSRASRIAKRHLDGCTECAAEYARVTDDLNAMRGIDFTKLPADYGVPTASSKLTNDASSRSCVPSNIV